MVSLSCGLVQKRCHSVAVKGFAPIPILTGPSVRMGPVQFINEFGKKFIFLSPDIQPSDYLLSYAQQFIHLTGEVSIFFINHLAEQQGGSKNVKRIVDQCLQR